MDLRNPQTGGLHTVYIDVDDTALSRRWLTALNELLHNDYHLEKNFCFLGFADSARSTEFLCVQINASIAAINAANLGYTINDHFTVANTIHPGAVGDHLVGGTLVHEKLNWLHRYFEDLQGTSGAMSEFYTRADSTTRWHIRQLNLLCHEYESLVLSLRKKLQAPDWQRPSQLMCWLNAPRFLLEPEDYQLFGVETINRSLGGVYVGVNKAVGKHHWEVFNDEGRDSRLSELVTTSLKPQTEAAGDFDIEWALDPGAYEFQRQRLADFRAWLTANGFDPDDKSLTIGHPKVAQVDVAASFGSRTHHEIWQVLSAHLDVYELRTGQARARYMYNWDNDNYQQLQIQCLEKPQ